MGLSPNEERAAWSCYCAALAHVVTQDNTPAQWEDHTAAALALGAHDRSMGEPVRTRSALLAEVTRLCGEEAGTTGPVRLDLARKLVREEGRRAVLGALENMMAARAENIRGAYYVPTPDLDAWIDEQRKEVL